MTDINHLNNIFVQHLAQFLTELVQFKRKQEAYDGELWYQEYLQERHINNRRQKNPRKKYRFTNKNKNKKHYQKRNQRINQPKSRRQNRRGN